MKTREYTGICQWCGENKLLINGECEECGNPDDEDDRDEIQKKTSSY